MLVMTWPILYRIRAMVRAAEERAWQLDIEHYDRFTRKCLLPDCCAQ